MNNEEQFLNIILIAIGLLLLMAGVLVLFFFLSRRKVMKTKLEQAEMEVAYQKEMIQSVLVTQEEERKRIAQDMHDAISSKLNIVSLHANILLEATKDTEEEETVSNILKVTSTVLENSRQIAHDILPPTLEKFGLKAAAQELFEEIETGGAFKVNLNFNFNQPSLHSDKELHLFRILQELTTNTLKYSKASQIDCSLRVEQENFELRYSDNGVGFDLDKAVKAKGLGLSGIENRASILNATTTIKTTPSQGFNIQIVGSK